MKMLPHVVTLTARGGLGSVDWPLYYVTVQHTPYCEFRIDEMKVTDAFDGTATRVGSIFIGTKTQINTQEQFDRIVRMETLAKDFSLRGTLGREQLVIRHAIVPITIQLGFERDCEAVITLSGTALKEPGDTRGILRNRAVNAYRDSYLEGSETWTKESWEKFEEMIERMRNAGD